MEIKSGEPNSPKENNPGPPLKRMKNKPHRLPTITSLGDLGSLKDESVSVDDTPLKDETEKAEKLMEETKKTLKKAIKKTVKKAKAKSKWQTTAEKVGKLKKDDDDLIDHDEINKNKQEAENLKSEPKLKEDD